MAPCALFAPSLSPVLDRGKGHEDAVGAPEMPAGGPGGQAVFDHQAHRPLDDARRVRASRWGESAPGGAAVLPARRAVVVRLRHQQVARTPRGQIPTIVQGALPVCVARRRMATFWAGLSLVMRA